MLNATCCPHKFTLVITDINMPQMDGYQLAQAIKATEMAWSDAIKKKSNYGTEKMQKRCVIVALTANRDNDVVRNA